MRQSLYRKYRPTDLDEVVGQNIIIQTLKNAIKNDNLSHAYLFAGPRGTGKTSIAKILAKMVNCENLQGYKPCNKCVNCTQYNNKQAIDIIEIDAASNNGVDEIRELKSKIDLVPSTGKYKIYIIDEVHMLSTGAFNALLKTLEEPPKHIIFILATTDPQKIPLTILSRCQRFDFKKLDNDQIIQKLKYVSEKEKITIEEEALTEIAILSDGGMRDALSLLDQVVAYADKNVTVEDVHEINGTLTSNTLKEFLKAIISKDNKYLFQKIDEFNSNGKDFFKLTEEIINYMRNILIYKTVPNYFETANESYNIEIDIDNLIEFIKYFNETLYDMKNNSNMKLLFELLIIRLTTSSDNKTCKNIVEIRINNTLCNFNKKEFLAFKDEYEMLYNIDDKDIDQLLKQGNLKAYGSNNFIMMYESQELVEKFNTNYKKIDQLLQKLFKRKIKGVAVEKNNWEKIKNEYNKGIKKYTYIEEED